MRAILGAAFTVMTFFLGSAEATDPPAPAPSATASASAGSSASAPAIVTQGGDSSRALALGSGSPSANACQRTILFGFSIDVYTCMLQQWALILGPNPSPAQLSIACLDGYLEELPMCRPYRRPAR